MLIWNRFVEYFMQKKDDSAKCFTFHCELMGFAESMEMFHVKHAK